MTDELARRRIRRHKVDLHRCPPACGNCGEPISSHRCRHVAPCCPGKCALPPLEDPA